MPEYQRGHLVLTENEARDARRLALWTREVMDFIPQRIQQAVKGVLADKRFKDQRDAKGLRCMEGVVNLDKAARPAVGDILYALDPYHAVWGAPGAPSPTDPGTGPNVATDHDLLDGDVHPDTVAAAVSRGSLIYGNSTPKWAELVAPGAASVLTHDATDVAWTTRRTASIFLPVNVWSTCGAVATLTGQAGSSPDLYEYWDFTAVADSELVCTIQTPQDYGSGQVTVKVVWATSGAAAETWAPEVRYLAAGDGTDLASAGTTMNAGAVSANVSANVCKITTIGTTLAPGAAGRPLRLVMRRITTDGNDNFTGSVRFVGLVLEYTPTY